MRSILLSAAALFLLTGLAAAGDITVHNYTGKTLHVATLEFTKAGSESTPAFSTWPNNWHATGWKQISPNGDKLVYSGNRDGIWIRIMQEDGITGTHMKPDGATKSQKFWVHGSRFWITENLDTPTSKTRFEAKTGPDQGKASTTTADPTKLGFSSVEFYYVSNNTRLRIGTPPATKKKSYDFDFVANWDEQKLMVREFRAPEGGRVVSYKLEIDSNRGTKKVEWYQSKDMVSLNGSIAGTGNFVDRTRGRYKGTVIIEYIPGGLDQSGLTLIDPPKPSLQVKPGKPLIAEDFKLDKGKAKPPAVKLIKCTFTNGTSETVSFRINGGKGLSTSLAAGQSTPVTVRVDPGVAPAIAIKQKNGKEMSYGLADGGKYVFQVQNGKIVNAFSK